MSRILHVVPALWSGAGQVVTRLCETQADAHDVAIVTSDRRGSDGDWSCYRQTLVARGVAHHPIDFLSRAPKTFAASVDALGALVRHWRPHVVHAHAGVPTAGAAAARAWTIAPYRLVAQCYSWNPDRPEWMDRQDLEAFAQADAVICSARAYARRLEQGGVDGARLIYLPWGVSHRAFDSAAADRGQLAAQTHRRVIGCVGRVEPRKGQLELCRAFSRCLRRDPDLRLEIVGPVADQAYADEVTRFVADAGLRSAVSLLGQVDDPLVNIAGWTLAVSLSSDEGQGLAVLEALALGIPVMARRAAGIEDYLRHGETGFVVESPEPDIVAAAVARVLADPALCRDVADRARGLVRRHYDWQAMLAQLETVYDGRVRWSSRRAA